MAGARPSAFKAGGGFLNDVDALIEDYEFTTEFPGGNSGKKKKNSDFTALYCVMTFKVDGVDESAVTTLFMGSADDFEISDDAKTLTPVDAEGGLRQNSDFFKFLNSMVSAEPGFPESMLPEDEINYEAIIGTRVRLKQQVDEEATARLGKKKSKDGKKEYNRTWLKVSSVLALPGKAGKTAKADPKGKKGKTAEPDEDEGDEASTLATESLVALLKKAPKKTILKKKLPVQIINQVGAKHPLREDVRKLVTSDDFLNAGELWSYDEDSQEITLN